MSGTAAYGTTAYWEERYGRDSEPFDWYQRWPHIKTLISQYAQPGMGILNVGCGNSRLSEEMLDDGFQNIMNIDFSQTVIQFMAKKNAGKPLHYEHMNIFEMTFPDATFDLAIDKATLDTVLCGENCTPNSTKMLREVYRVLKPNGTYICISHADPDQRLHYFYRTELDWKVEHQTLPKPMVSTLAEDRNTSNLHYVYICRKGVDLAN